MIPIFDNGAFGENKNTVRNEENAFLTVFCIFRKSAFSSAAVFVELRIEGVEIL